MRFQILTMASMKICLLLCRAILMMVAASISDDSHFHIESCQNVKSQLFSAGQQKIACYPAALRMRAKVSLETLAEDLFTIQPPDTACNLSLSSNIAKIMRSLPLFTCRISLVMQKQSFSEITAWKYADLEIPKILFKEKKIASIPLYQFMPRQLTQFYPLLILATVSRLIRMSHLKQKL